MKSEKDRVSRSGNRAQWYRDGERKGRRSIELVRAKEY